MEFFTAQINNDHTRKAYLNATQRFSAWCEGKGIAQLADVQPVHIAPFLKELQGEVSAPTVKQHLAALRMLFDWLVLGHVLDVNPAHAVRGPRHVVRKGKTPVLQGEEARALLDSLDSGSLVGLRDRALIGLMTYSFARVGAVMCGCMKRAARNTRCRVTISWSNFWMRTLRRPGSPLMKTGRCSAPRPDARES